MPPLDPLAAFRLDGRVAIVTGASSGLGARFARVLDAAGARVVLAARRRERLENLASELADAEPVACDLSQPDAPGALGGFRSLFRAMVRKAKQSRLLTSDDFWENVGKRRRGRGSTGESRRR